MLLLHLRIIYGWTQQKTEKIGGHLLFHEWQLFYIFAGASAAAKSSTLPHQRTAVVNRDRERDGYYSDRNELIRERERERERDRGYLSDHNSR